MVSEYGNYILQENGRRRYQIQIQGGVFHISGKFWYLMDKEFKRCKAGQENALTKNFIGMGKLRKRSPKKTLLFVLAGTVLEIVKSIIDHLSDLADKANDVTSLFNIEAGLPEWVDYVFTALVLVCFLFGVVLFFSQKSVIEISFLDKRIAVPEKSMTNQEYMALFQALKAAK